MCIHAICLQAKQKYITAPTKIQQTLLCFLESRLFNEFPAPFVALYFTMIGGKSERINVPLISTPFEQEKKVIFSKK